MEHQEIIRSVNRRLVRNVVDHNQSDKNAALRAVVFDAVVMATALDVLRQEGAPDNDVGRGENQLAVETALIKFRSLYDFLFEPRKRSDDLVVGDLGCEPSNPEIPDARILRTSVHKYSAHLTWVRISEQSEDAFLQRSASLRKPCELVLASAWEVIQQALSNGYQLNEFGQKYYGILEKLMQSRVDKPAKGHG